MIGGRFEFTGTERFEVVRRLGEGGMGVVYEAIDHALSARLALKTLRGLGGADLLQFKREFRALQDVQHPNLISLGELYEHNGQWFFTMELVRGVEIIPWTRRDTARALPPHYPPRMDEATTVLDSAPPSSLGARAPSTPAPPDVDVARVRDALVQLAQALLALHGASKIHRDIKPSNVLVTPEGRVVLLDFGLVADLDVEAKSDVRLAGTVPYMAPEILSRSIGPESDWYAVGVMLYEMLTARLPFEGSAAEILLRKATDKPLPPCAICPDVDVELEALCLRLLDPDPGKRPRGAEIVSRLGRASSTSLLPPPSVEVPFVGRDAELLALGGAVADARAGHPVTVIVDGESGIGKTALVRHFVETLQGAPVVLRGRCYEREAVPYKGIDGVVDALAQHLAALDEGEVASLVPEGAGLLPQVFPVLGRVLPIVWSPEPAAGVEPHVVRARTFAALGGLLARLSRGRALVITIDDLQWADADSLALLAELLRQPDLPLLLVATLRDRAIELPGDVRLLHVGPLPREDALELAHALTPRIGAFAEAEAVASEASGHPFFMEQLARHSRRLRAEARADVRLDDVLAERIAALPPDARGLLEVVCLAGAPVPERVAANAGLDDAAAFHRCFALLRGAKLVRSSGARARDEGASGWEAIEATHDRIRDAVMSRLGEGARRSGAMRLALALEASGGSDDEALAAWFRAGGDAARAARHSAIAAERAASALAFDRAASLYEDALRYANDPARAQRLRVGLADALANAGRGAQAARAYAAAAAFAPAEAAHVLHRRAADELLRSGHIDEGLDALGGVLSDVGLSLPASAPGALASALYHRARVELRRGRTRTPPASEAPIVVRRAEAAWCVAAGLSLVDPVRAADFQARAMLYALDTGEAPRIARAYAMAACFSASERVARARAPAQLAAATALARGTGDPYTQAWLPLARAMIAFGDGRFSDALAEGTAAHAMFRDQCTGALWEATSARSITFWSLGYLGDMGLLGQRVDELLDESADRGDRYAAINVRTGTAHLARLAADRPEASRSESTRAMLEWSRRGYTLQHVFDLFTQCETLLYEGRAEEGRERLEAGWRKVVTSLVLRAQTARVFMMDLRGRLEIACAARAGRLRRPALVRRSLARADDLDAQGLGWATGLAHTLRAAAAHVRGDRSGAVAWLTQADDALGRAELALHALVARRARAILEGDGLARARAEREIRARGVVSVERWSAMLAPGLAT